MKKPLKPHKLIQNRYFIFSKNIFLMSIFILVILVRITDLPFYKSTQMTPTPALVNLSELKVAFYRGETYLTRPEDDCHLQVTEENIKMHLEEYIVKHALKSDPTKTDYYGARDIIIDMMEFMHNERLGSLVHFVRQAKLAISGFLSRAYLLSRSGLDSGQPV